MNLECSRWRSVDGPQFVQGQSLPPLPTFLMQRSWSRPGASQVAAAVKNPLASAEDARDSGLILGWGRSPGVGNGNPVVSPGDFHGERSLAGYRPRGCRVGYDWARMLAWSRYCGFPAGAGLSFVPSGFLKPPTAQQLENRSVYSVSSCLPTGVWKWVGLFILGKQSLRGTLKHCLQISEGLSPGRRIRFVSWNPQGKTDTRTGVLREVGRAITLIDVADTAVGTAPAFPSLMLKKDTLCLNFLTYSYDSIIKSLSWAWVPHHEGCASRNHTTTWLRWEERDSSIAGIVGDSKIS